MPYAKIAAQYIHAWCRATFTKDPDRMASIMANGDMIDAFDHIGYGTHKQIPAAKLNHDLELTEGSGVYSYWRMKDGSYLLRTCPGALAWWSGKDEDEAHWHELREPKAMIG